MREIELPSDAIVAEVRGENEVEERIPTLKRIHIHYALKIPVGSRETVDRALSRHVAKCPTARSLAPGVEVTWSADITESPAQSSPQS